MGNLFLIDDSKDSDATNQHKPELIKNTPNYVAVVKALTEKTHTLRDVNSKYELSEKLELELKQINN